MSQLVDKIAEVDARVDAAKDRIVAEQTALQGEVADLQAKLDAAIAGGGAPDPADVAALDALKVKLDAIDPATPSTI